MKSYKLITARKPHKCYECGLLIPNHCPTVIDPALYGDIVGTKAYFHTDCYMKCQLANGQDIREFEIKLYGRPITIVEGEAAQEGISQKALIITARKCHLGIWRNITLGSGISPSGEYKNMIVYVDLETITR